MVDPDTERRPEAVPVVGTCVPGAGVDVGEFAWSPENFERQRRFVTDAIERAAIGSEHARALGLWAKMIVAHPRESVMVGRRWRWTTHDATV